MDNIYYILSSYLLLSLIIVLTSLYVSIDSRNNNVLIIKKESFFYKLRYVTYIVLYTPAHGINTIKKAKQSSLEPVTLCGSFWSSVLAFSIVLPISIVFISIYFISIGFWYGLTKLFSYIKKSFSFIYKYLKTRKKVFPEKIQDIQIDYTILELIEYYNDTLNTENDNERFFKFAIITGFLLDQLKEQGKLFHSIHYVAKEIKDFNKKLKTKTKHIDWLVQTFISNSILDFDQKYIPDSFIGIDKHSTTLFCIRLLLGPIKFTKLTDLLERNKYKKKFNITQKQVDNFVSDYLDELQESKLREVQKYYDDEVTYVQRPEQEDIDKGDLEITILESPEFNKIEKEIYKLILPFLKEAYLNSYDNNKSILNKTFNNIDTYFKEANNLNKLRLKQEELKQKEDAIKSKIEYEQDKLKRIKRQNKINKIKTLLNTVKGKVCPTIQVK
jgi:hypothetical protein